MKRQVAPRLLLSQEHIVAADISFSRFLHPEFPHPA
jgi:hypothetical protein